MRNKFHLDFYLPEAGNFILPPPSHNFADLFNELTAWTAIVSQARQNRRRVLCDLSPVKLLLEGTHESWRLSSTYISAACIYRTCHCSGDCEGVRAGTAKFSHAGKFRRNTITGTGDISYCGYLRMPHQLDR